MRSRLIVIAGIPCSGKSTLAEHIVDNGLESDFINIKQGNAVHVDIDKYVESDTPMRECLQNYRKDIALGIAQDNDVIITTASTIGNHIRLIKERHNIDLNGKIQILFMPCDKEVAQKRYEQRVTEGGHSVDNGLLQRSDVMINLFIEKAQKEQIPIYKVTYERGDAPKITDDIGRQNTEGRGK